MLKPNKNKISLFLTPTIVYTSIIFLFFSTLLRATLIIREFNSLNNPLSSVPSIFIKGFIADFCPLVIFISLFLILSLFIPQKITQLKIMRFIKHLLMFAFVTFLLFISVTEFAFWNEFTSRFNFIAVDYLIYTNEVMKNVMESYPMGIILGSIFFFSYVVYFLVLKIVKIRKKEKLQLKARLILVSIFTLTSFFYYQLYSRLLDKDDVDNLSKQLSSNGIYRFVEAFHNNEIDYEAFYRVLPKDQVKDLVYKKFQKHTFKGSVEKDDLNIFKRIVRVGPEKKYNVVFVLIESLGGKYIGSLGNTEKITPYLDKLSEESIFLTKLFSTGTRTVRGIEATMLSFPPTPGYSIVKRPQNENLHSMGSIFHDKGYELKFLYGGQGYFDNMNYFFSHNHFSIVDRDNFAPEEIHFANAWGVCDEDLFAKSLKEADLSYQNGRPFLQFMLTTSNHRPFTYPDNRIDIPSKSGRSGAVKYTDYAIGKYIEAVKNKPWFDNTIFIFIADHSTEGRGKFDLSMNDFHIPAWFYAPKILKSQKIETPVSQVDILPTILGMLNFSYDSYFIGKDVFDPNYETNVFVGNYQHVGYYNRGNLISLGPKRSVKYYQYDPITMNQTTTQKEEISVLEEAISFYQFSSEMWKWGLMKERSSIKN